MAFSRTTAGAGAVAFARSKLGDPYEWGEEGPVGYDCSGLVQAAYEAVGLDISRTTYTQYKVAAVGLSTPWAPGDLGFITGSDPGPQGEPGHVGMFVGVGVIVDYAGKRHEFEPETNGQDVFVNAPFTGDVGGVRFDYFSGIVAHTRPANLYPAPPPLPPLPIPSPDPPTAAQVSLCNLIRLANVGQAEKAVAQGWSLWYFGADGHFHPQVDGKPTGVPLYANSRSLSKVVRASLLAP